MSGNILQSALVGILIAVVIGGAAWVSESSPDAVPRQGLKLSAVDGGEPIYVQVQKGDSAGSIGRRLAEARGIESAGSFQRLAKITGAERDLAAGEYEFL